MRSSLDHRRSPAIEEWLSNFEHRHAIAVLGPDPFGSESARRLVLVHPQSELAAAEAMVTASDFGLSWRAAGGSPVAWETLNRAREDSRWRDLWREQGFRSFVRVEIPLPAMRGFECFLFTESELQDTDAAARLAWSVMSIWPTMREEIRSASAGALTERERTCLSLAFQGFTAAETAERMQIPERRVNSTYQQAMEKLQAPNKVAAIQRACWLGAI